LNMENWTRWNRSGPANPIFLCAYLCVRELPGRGSHVKDLTISRGSRCSSPRCGEALYAVRVLAKQPAFANVKLPAREYSRTVDVTPFLFPPHWRPYGTAMNVTTLPGRVVLPHT